MLVRARPPHNLCVCMLVCVGWNELVALHAGQALLLLLLLPWLLPSSYACAARPSSVASMFKEDGCASKAVAHVRCNLHGVGLLGLRGGAGRGGRRQRGWRAVKDTTEAQKEVVGGLNEEMPDMMIRGPYAQIDFIYEQDKWDRNRDAYAGKRRRPERSGLDSDFEPTRGRALFENEIWDQNSLGPVKYQLYLRAMSGEEVERCRDILPGTRAYAMCVRLWSACRFGLEEEIVPALLNGASVHMWDLECERWDREEGDTPYDKSGLEGCNALHWAAFGDEPLCIDTLTQCGARVDAETTQVCMRMCVCVPLSLSVKSVCVQGWTALDVAAYLGHTRACMALIRNGADVTRKLNCAHFSGDDTIQHTAADLAEMTGPTETALALRLLFFFFNLFFNTRPPTTRR